MGRFYILIALSSLLVAPLAGATIFGTVRGIVHDPQHRPVPDVSVVLKAKGSDFTLMTQTDANGEFHLDAVPVGEYTVTVSTTGFALRNKRRPYSRVPRKSCISSFNSHRERSRSAFRQRPPRHKPSR